MSHSSMGLSFLLLLATSQACVGDIESGGELTDLEAGGRGWRPAGELYKKVVNEVAETTTFAPVATWPAEVSITAKACGPGCNSIRSSILTCPGTYYPEVRGFRAKDAQFIRRANGTENGSEIAHAGFWFYSCDDFCGGQPKSGCAPGNDDRENEYGIVRSLEDNRFAFYQSYDSNNCGARHRLDDLKAGFSPEASSTTFVVSVVPDGSYVVQQLRRDSSVIASQRVSNCTIAGDCDVLCAGSLPGDLRKSCEQNQTNQTCPVNCEAKHKDQVNNYKNGASGKINAHMMKKGGAANVFWSTRDSSGKPSVVRIQDGVKVDSAGPAEGMCTLPD